MPLLVLLLCSMHNIAHAQLKKKFSEKKKILNLKGNHENIKKKLFYPNLIENVAMSACSLGGRAGQGQEGGAGGGAQESSGGAGRRDLDDGGPPGLRTDPLRSANT